MEKPPKVGIGPIGPKAGIIQVVVLTIALTIITLLLPVEFQVTKVLGWALPFVISLGLISLFGGNWPLAPPGGKVWKPGMNRLIPGIGLTAFWLILTFLSITFFENVFPRLPSFPFFLWYGVIVFTIVLLWGINWDAWPLRRLPPYGALIGGLVGSYLIAALIWTLVNLSDTPAAGLPIDPKGPININWLTGFLLWFIAWFFIVSPVFVTQCLTKLKQPWIGLIQTIVSLILAFISWTISLVVLPIFKAPITLSWAGIASSIVTWAIILSWHLSFYPFDKYKQPKRGIYTFMLLIVMVAIWVAIFQAIFTPLEVEAIKLKLPFDRYIAIITFNLVYLAPALIAHNAYWLRIPLTLPTPPGTPPPDKGV